MGLYELVIRSQCIAYRRWQTTAEADRSLAEKPKQSSPVGHTLTMDKLQSHFHETQINPFQC